MRKIFLLSLAATMIISCKDDESAADNSYPTDNLNPEPVTKSLIGLVYSSKNPAAPLGEIIRESLEAKFDNDVNHMSIVSTTSDNLYSAASDSLNKNYGSVPTSTFFMNGEVTNVADAEAAIMQIEENSTTIPLVSVAHIVCETDSSFNVFVKLKFNKDTVYDLLFVQSYFLADIEAKTFDSGALDLRQQPDGTYVTNSDNASTWNQNVASIDTTNKQSIFNQGDAFVHRSVLLAGFNKENVFGTKISSYSKFGPEFFLGDVIGLKQNPIVQHFLKSDFDDLEFTYTPRFLTVVWNYNFINLRYEYVNSYMN